MSSNRILIIEDDADVRLGYHILLKSHGFLTFFAVDSISAVSEARKSQPDLIILDLGLPGGDGFVVLDRFRANTYLAVIPVIVVSARGVHAYKQRSLDAGAAAYVQKPWDDRELLAIIAGLLPASHLAGKVDAGPVLRATSDATGQMNKPAPLFRIS